MGLARIPAWLFWPLIACGSAGAIYCFARGAGWHHPQAALGTVADWAAAAGAFFAALVALGIANHDRTVREIEQEEEREATSKIQARLVQVRASTNSGSPTLHIRVVNYGQLPVLDVDLVGASWVKHQDARWGTNWKWSGRIDSLGPIEPLAQVDLRHEILLPRNDQDDSSAAFRKTASFDICFAHPDRDEPILELIPPATPRPDIFAAPPRYRELDLSDVVVTVHFTTADGLRWQVIVQSEFGDEPVRIHRRSREKIG